MVWTCRCCPAPSKPSADFRIPYLPAHGLRLAAVVYDLIPLLFPECYLPDARVRRRFHEAISALRRYDAILTISEWTRSDCLRLLGLLPHQVVTIGTASNPDFFTILRPPTNGETSAALLDLLRLGVPTIVGDVGTFSASSDTAVRKVPWAGDDLSPRVQAMVKLADHPDARAALGRSALQYIVDAHDWSNLASNYAEIIEQTYARTRWRRDRDEDLRLGLRSSEVFSGRPTLHGTRSRGS